MLYELNQKFHGLLARFHRDERGTSMTEFVAMTPVFITIFAGTLQLSQLQHSSIEVQVTATKNMWAEALPVQKSVAAKPMHSIPMTAAGDAITQINSRGQTMIGQAQDVARFGALAVRGTPGESWAITKLPEAAGLVDYDLNTDDGKVANTLDKIVDKSKGKSTHDLVNDMVSKPSGGGGLAGVFNGVLSAAGARPAIAAGIRYGQALGVADKTVNIGGQSITAEAGYDVLVAPFPHSNQGWHALTVGTVRMTLANNPSVDTILGIHSGSKGRWKSSKGSAASGLSP